MTRTLIIADDLTGALDSAVAFAGSGQRVIVARRPADLTGLDLHALDCLAVATGSRDIPATAAAERLTGMLAALDLRAFDQVVKKVDSRLKGHVALETRLVAEAWAQAHGAALPQIALPALPSMGRVQQAGQVTGTGIEAPLPLAKLLPQAQVPDVTTSEQMAQAVAVPDRALWIGARDMSFALAARQGITPAPRPAVPRPALVAIGSRDPITLAQIAPLRGQAQVIAAPNGDLPQTHSLGPLCVVQLTPGEAQLTGAAAGAHFAGAVAGLMHSHPPATLIATGGETAQAILDALDIGRLEILAEMAPGVPLCIAAAPWGDLRIMTKSGGFGAPDLLATLLDLTPTAKLCATTHEDTQ